ncbi:hypothetical protein [Nonomuraea deserti]|uniref:hypothetical protein n=1 Tax=Nonomuraea deserti TaxID=1848322 RepID=UPI001FE26FC8|nr:hypothetical protein [Nonomuraea deserti]
MIRVTEGVEQAARPFPQAAAPLAGIWARLQSHEEVLLGEITLADVVSSAREPSGSAGLEAP